MAYFRARGGGDMIEVYKIVKEIYDSKTTCILYFKCCNVVTMVIILNITFKVNPFLTTLTWVQQLDKVHRD